jgi:hypothetical protein
VVTARQAGGPGAICGSRRARRATARQLQDPLGVAIVAPPRYVVAGSAILAPARDSTPLIAQRAVPAVIRCLIARRPARAYANPLRESTSGV